MAIDFSLYTDWCANTALYGLAALYWVSVWFQRWPAQETMVRTGYSLIPEAQQIDDLLDPAWHKVCNYTEPDTAEWQSVALFGGRYELTMAVHIQIDRQSGKVTKVLDKPQFTLAQVTSIEVRDDGTIGSIYYGESHSFAQAEWQKVVAAKGDFSVIGIRLVQGKPVANFDAYRNSPPNGMQVTSPGGKLKP